MADFTINSLASSSLTGTDTLIKSNTEGVLTKISGSELKNNLTGQYKYGDSVGLVPSSGVTINTVNALVGGAITMYEIIFTTTVEIAKDTPILSGLANGVSGYNGAPLVNAYNNATGGSQLVYRSQGELRPLAVIPANTQLRCTLMYITAAV